MTSSVGRLPLLERADQQGAGTLPCRRTAEVEDGLLWQPGLLLDGVQHAPVRLHVPTGAFPATALL